MNIYDSQYMSLQEEKLKLIIEKQTTVVAAAEDFNVTRQTVHKKMYAPLKIISTG